MSPSHPSFWADTDFEDLAEAIWIIFNQRLLPVPENVMPTPSGHRFNPSHVCLLCGKRKDEIVMQGLVCQEPEIDKPNLVDNPEEPIRPEGGFSPKLPPDWKAIIDRTIAEFDPIHRRDPA